MASPGAVGTLAHALFPVPTSSVHRVEDVDEEVGVVAYQVFLLYTLRTSLNAPSLGLGCIDSKTDTLDIVLDAPDAAPPRGKHKKGKRSVRERTITLHQNVRASTHQTTALRSTAGDTGSVVWRSSVLLAQHCVQSLLATQLHPHALFRPDTLRGRNVLELGAGTGVFPACLLADASWAEGGSRPLQWIATDREENLALLHKNLDAYPVHPDRAVLTVAALDWAAFHPRSLDTPASLQQKQLAALLAPFQSPDATDELVYPDLLVCIDCVYNPALHAPLVAALDTLCAVNVTTIFLAIQLRDPDNTRAFLESWTQSGLYTIYALEDSILPAPMRHGYAAWLAWRT